MTTRFSWITDPTSTQPTAIWNSVLATSPNFLAIPSLGSLVRGWTLIVPKRQMLSLAEMSPDERTELANFTGEIRNTLSTLGESLFEFEHGAARAGSSAGCGVDQAHLHIVPLPFDLISHVDQRTDITPLKLAAEVANCVGPNILAGSEYLWCSDGRARFRAYRAARPESQWFRRLIARELRLEHLWNYSQHPFQENVVKTIEIFGLK